MTRSFDRRDRNGCLNIFKSSGVENYHRRRRKPRRDHDLAVERTLAVMHEKIICNFFFRFSFFFETVAAHRNSSYFITRVF